MKLRVGYELKYEFPRPTPAILILNVHYTRVSDLATPDHIIISPSVPISGYRDGFGNWCSRIVAPSGQVRISTDAVVSDTGLPDPVEPGASQVPVEELPEEALVFRSLAAFATATVYWIWPGNCWTRDARLGSRPSRLRFCTSAYRVRLRACAGDEDSIGGVPGAAGSLPRLRASGDSVLPCLEYSGAILHRLSRRCGHAVALSAGRFRGLVRGLRRRPLVYIRSEEQYSSYWEGLDRTRAGCSRRRHNNHVRP